MAGKILESRDLIGRFFWALRELGTPAWAETLGFFVDSDKETEEYGWIGNAPSMREWKGQRQTHGLREFTYKLTNVLYEAAMRIAEADWRRDKHSQIETRVDELALKARRHWNTLLTTLIEDGETETAYDGQLFFDTDHVEGDSGTQDNDITASATTTTAPTASEMEIAIFDAVSQLLGFKDDQGDLINEDAMSFLVMVPKPFWRAAAGALRAERILEGGESRDNLLININGLSFQLVVNPRLTWTTKFATFRTDGVVKPFIRQEEVPIRPTMLGPGSEHARLHKEFLFLVEATRAAGYGYWQHAVLTTLT